MVKVLILGASGFIGLATALALRREGHRVFGVIRNKDFASVLQKNEITPIIGDIKDLKSLQTHIESAAVVIDTTAGPDNDTVLALLAAVGAAGKHTGILKRFIYTSGLLVYGDHKNEVVDETFPLKTKNPRAGLESAVTSSKEVEGVVIRPPWVYGNDSGRYMTSWWEPNSKGEIEILGNPDKSWSWVHVDDLADAYVRVIGASKSLVAGEVFDVADDTRGTFLQIRVAMAKAAGIEGKVVHSPAGTDPFSQMLESTVIIKAQKIRRILGWTPKRGPFLDDVDLYYHSYRAAHPKTSTTSTTSHAT